MKEYWITVKESDSPLELWAYVRDSDNRCALFQVTEIALFPHYNMSIVALNFLKEIALFIIEQEQKKIMDKLPNYNKNCL
jgi:hypothetical protein